MKERPIIFSSEMVLAILSGQKNQTRRVIKPQPKYIQMLLDGRFEISPDGGFDREVKYITCPYGKIGDQLWVRETWTNLNERENDYSADIIGYKADETARYITYNKQSLMDTALWKWETMKWKPSTIMPRWASRIQLEITNIRVERVRDITVNDCFSEGIRADYFQKLWNSINKKSGYSWESNPWVWVIEFKRIIQEQEK